MNKTMVYLAFIALIVIGLLGALLLLFIAPEHFGTFTGFILVLIGLATTFAGTLWSMGKTKEAVAEAKQHIEELKVDANTKLDVVQKQTNGTLTRLVEDNKKLSEEKAALQRRNAELEAALVHTPKRGIQ